MNAKSSTKTIREAQNEYEQQGEDSVHLGFRNAVDAMLRDGFEGSFSNDCYSDALVLTQKMLSRLTHSLRVLSGCECDSFFRLLEKPLKEALERIRRNGGKARFVLVNDTLEISTRATTLLKLANEFPDVLELSQAVSAHPISHFMVADENMLRVEEKHDKLTSASLETAIKAKVFFDEKRIAKGYIELFEKVWTNLAETA